jgi:hypothetical protein
MPTTTSCNLEYDPKAITKQLALTKDTSNNKKEVTLLEARFLHTLEMVR